jgi:hypothetical protein
MSTDKPDNSGITFVCGALRSGTTLLNLMLDHHPELSNPGEMDFLFECPRTAEGRYDLAKFKQKLVLNPIFLRHGLTYTDGLEHDALVRSFVESKRKPGKRLTVTVHRHFERIPAVFPEARFVHLLRDPRDVARSSIGMGWAGNVYCGVNHWIESERSYEKLRELVPAERIFELKNEALVADPHAALSGLCEFLGVSFDPAMLSYPETTTYSPPDPGLVEQWRKVQSPREIGLVEGKLGEMLEARGYRLSGHPLIEPDESEKNRLEREDRRERFSFRARRYGLFWTVMDTITRHVRIEPVRKAVRRRFNEIGEKHLK